MKNFNSEKLFMNSSGKKYNVRERYERKYKSASTNILLIAVFSAINLALLLGNSDRYFLFSAYIPYLLGDYAMFFSGRYPEEYYAEFPEMEFMTTPIFAVIVAVAVGVILFYVLCWFFARKKKAVFLVLALSLFVIDTLVMFAVIGISVDMMTDIVFHIWAIVSLSLGINAFLKLKKIPDSAEDSEKTEEAEEAKAAEEKFSYPDTPVLRMAESGQKTRVLAKADFEGHEIIFCRTKRMNELVIDGKVYAEYEVLAETEHTLSANVGGHQIKATFDGKLNCYIYADGKIIAKKFRLF